MPHWKKYKDNKYLGAWDLEGGDMMLIMDHVEHGELPPETQGQPPRRCGLLYFRNFPRPMVLNSVNPTTISGMYTNDTAKWEGKPIAVYASRTTFRGAEVDCIRVRPTPPAMVVETRKASSSRPPKPRGKKPKQLPPRAHTNVQDAEVEEVPRANV